MPGRERRRANKRLAVLLGLLALAFFVLGWFVTVESQGAVSHNEQAVIERFIE